MQDSPNTFGIDKQKLLSALSHGSIFLSSLIASVGIPIAILFISEDPVVKENAKEAINFHLNVWLYGAIFGFLCLLLIGYPLLLVLFIVHWTMPVLAIMHTFREPSQPYRYPFIFRVV
ncbi:DUF4870 domain-containing protein [Oculatella sp. FACHB-28]|uniref:DUF4870 domain-containing protein n=1 Tax=Cyanophyceae TaxID=3028117 RepID=UPI001686DD68|nr:MULTISPECIES: DUF4870 domain-containing protein [Cyanophyceae]MBD1866222.1 DUF4870 domain-containing protein [Cyanobacteria bacterium FACHB-471]MBD2001180.1 DUF4870 domain-containing protein [Leptolyngbya sp. FACHB-541]MBD2056341.1 DUF4870 domain-containing protein [Oculatella sp. FACHB-28]MBD2070691.1 DUF4870 domain-containing protein [Leptolyngbya sp. FACHB-671]